jgi:diacylglycerol kinase
MIVLLAIFFNISKNEWILVLLCSMIVLSLEGINTAIERLCNENDTNFNINIKIIKDTSAGAVLISCIFSAIIGMVIFFPYIYKLVARL